MKDQTLRDAISKLPEHVPSLDAWKGIEQSLDFEDAIHNAIPSLPTYEPKNDAWSALEQGLPQTRQIFFTTVQKYSTWRYVAVAAVVSMVAVGTYLLERPRGSYTSLTYSEEIVSTDDASITNVIDQSEQELWTYIQQLCLEPAPPVCDHPEFIALRSHIDELTEEEKALQETIKQFGYDPQLVKYQVRIENMKADAAKELIQMAL